MNLLIFNLIWHISVWVWTLRVEIAGLSSISSSGTALEDMDFSFYQCWADILMFLITAGSNF
jgi:hypothetical protein